MVRLYANENLPLPVVEELRLLGHDVLTIQETGQAQRVHNRVEQESDWVGKLIRVNRPPR